MGSDWIQWDGQQHEPVLVFAHGAGAGPQSPFMQAISDLLVAQGVGVLRFEFPYWTQVREQARRRPPNPQQVLQACMLEVCEQVQNHPLWLLGKSMGARVAFQVADQAGALGAIGLGFPFHPAAKKDKTRTHELYNERGANLVIQGTADPLGKQDWVKQQRLPDNLQLHWVAQGNHDLVPKKATGVSAEQSWQQVAARVIQFIRQSEQLLAKEVNS
ncbi:MAG: alpha/beta hydrolase [Idiomarina sp.]|nr:alpha/beta hydrolase [Idiomarina sp.]